MKTIMAFLGDESGATIDVLNAVLSNGKRRIIGMLVLLWAASVNADAVPATWYDGRVTGGYTEECNGVVWNFFPYGDGVMLSNNSYIYRVGAVGRASEDGVYVIPEILGGKKVIRIGSYAFYDLAGAKKIIVPSTVTSVGEIVRSGGAQQVVFLGDVPDGLAASEISANISCKRKYAAHYFRVYSTSSFGGFVDDVSNMVEIVSSKVRDKDPTIMDVVYKVTSKKPTVKVRVLAFEDGERSFAKVIRPETFVNDTNDVATACNVGDGIVPNVEHTISWRVSTDFTNRLAKLKFEVMACEGELLPLELMTIPASDQYGKMTISWNAISDSQWFDAMLWLYADKDAGLKLENGKLLRLDTGICMVDGTTCMYSDWIGWTYYNQYGSYVGYHYESRTSVSMYVLNRLGYEVLSGSPLTYANSETRLGLSPSGARQYAYKIEEE